MSTSPSRQPSTQRRDALDRDSLLIVGVSGMHSHTCETKIIQRLNRFEGVRETEVDFPSGNVSVIFDARRVTAHELLDGIVETGYRVGEYHLGRGGAAPESID